MRFFAHYRPFSLSAAMLLGSILAFGGCEKGCDARLASPPRVSPDREAPIDAEQPRDTMYYENILKRDWETLKLKVKEQWDKIDDYDLSQIEGSWEKLSTTLQAKYQKTKEEADRWIKEFMTRNKAN